MKRLIYLIPICLLAACSQSAWLDGPSQDPYQSLQHGMIQLGEKLEDPYTVDNMQKALENVYGSKAERVDISATDHYVRFLPQDNEQYMALLESGLPIAGMTVMVQKEFAARLCAPAGSRQSRTGTRSGRSKKSAARS